MVLLCVLPQCMVAILWQWSAPGVNLQKIRMSLIE